MRFSFCYRLVRLKGFFWARRLFLYRRRFAGWVAPVGLGSRARVVTWGLGGGFWGRGYRPRSAGRRPYHAARIRGVGLALLQYFSPKVEPLWVSAWGVLRQLCVRAFRGYRYRAGLPARGQRTHTNARTTRRVRSGVVTYLRPRYWQGRLWEAAKTALPNRVSRPRPAGRTSKVVGGKGKPRVVRTKKKADAWR